MILGVTGTRRGRPDLTERFFRFLCDNYVSELHHGDCVGWDEEAFLVAKHYKIPTVSHPPDRDDYRAFTDSDMVLPPKGYMERNRDIVDAVEYIIAAPDGPEVVRSGTWATVRFAKKQGVSGVVWMPPSKPILT